MSRYDDFLEVRNELAEKGTLAGSIEYGPDGEWIGMVLEKDMTYSDPENQVHFAHCVFNFDQRI